MAEMRKKPIKTLKDYGIEVKPYLTFSQLKTIVTRVLEEDDVVDRMFIKEMYVLKFATNVEIGEEITSEEHDQHTSTGLIDEVMKTVRNVYKIDELVKEHESVYRAFNQLMKLTDETEHMLKELNIKNDK